jgi:hypothetical protein
MCGVVMQVSLLRLGSLAGSAEQVIRPPLQKLVRWLISDRKGGVVDLS